MKIISSQAQLQTLLADKPMLLLFGGPSCSVCHSIRPRLATSIEERFDGIECGYIDCQQSPDLCAQYGVFSIPAVKVFLGGRWVAETAGVFSVNQFLNELERPYSIWQSMQEAG